MLAVEELEIDPEFCVGEGVGIGDGDRQFFIGGFLRMVWTVGASVGWNGVREMVGQGGVVGSLIPSLVLGESGVRLVDSARVGVGVTRGVDLIIDSDSTPTPGVVFFRIT
jgi:hypothetical protein